MDPLRLFPIIAWLSLPGVMFGGYSLLRLLAQGDKLTAFQQSYFRAGHAHAGVLLVLSLVYYQYLGQTTLSTSIRWTACIVLTVGILAQSGGFFLHMFLGQPGRPSVGTAVSTIGAVLLAVAVLVLAWGLITHSV